MTSGTTLDILLLGVAVFCILSVLTILGELLRARFPAGQTNPIVESFMTKVHSWWAMVIALSLALLGGRTGMILLFGFVSFAALREFLTLAEKRRADHLSLVLAFFVILPLQYLFVAFDWSDLFTVFIPVYVFLLLPVISALRGDPKIFLIRVAETQWGQMICVYCISHIPALLALDMPDGSDRAILLIVFFVMVVQLGDLFEHLADRSFGRHRVAPNFSSKTIEGMVTGILCAAMIGALLSWITPFGFPGAIAMATLASVSGKLGSLVFAAIKRDRGIKDWSHLIPGHGGFLDQLDSVIFAAPVFYHVSRHLLS